MNDKGDWWVLAGALVLGILAGWPGSVKTAPVEPNLGIGLSSTNDHFEVKVRSGEHAASVIFRLNIREFTSVEVTNYIDRTFAPQGWVPLPGVPGAWISTTGVLTAERMEVVE